MIKRSVSLSPSEGYPSGKVSEQGEPCSCNGECLKGVQAADLTLGKPSLFPLSTSATVAQALKALKFNKDVDALSVWVDTWSEGDGIEPPGLTKTGGRAKDRYQCGGAVTTADIITFLAREESLLNPRAALKTQLKLLFPSLSQAVEHVHPRTSLCQALQMMLRGVQYLVIPIMSWRQRGQGKQLRVPRLLLSTDLPSDDYCWISQEDVVRHLLSSCVGTFYPLPMMSLETLGLINRNVMTVNADSPASTAHRLLQRASQEMTAVAVVTTGSRRMGLWATRSSNCRQEGRTKPRLVGDISTHTMRGCTKTTASALATLSIREFLQFVHDDAAGCPSHQLIEKVFTNLSQKTLRRTNYASSRSCPSLSFPSWLPPDNSRDRNSDVSEILSDDENTSSDEEPGETQRELSPNADAGIDTKLGKPGAQQTRDRTLITCTPQSSLVAVMAQALAHRVNHVWVTNEEGGLEGIVTYKHMIHVLLSRLHSCGFQPRRIGSYIS